MAQRQLQLLIHYPNLRTILMIENVLKKAELAISKNELMRRLPKKIMRQTLNAALDYMEERGLIIDGQKGVLWIYNENPKFVKAIKKGVEV